MASRSSASAAVSRLAALGLVILAAPVARADEPRPTPRPGPAITGRPYRPTEELKDHLNIAGSTSMSHLVATWSSELRRHHPTLVIDIDCEGSETALPALAGDNSVAAVSRPVSAAELKTLSDRAGKKLQAFTVCLDDLAVVVHPDNPVTRLTPAQFRDALGTAPGQKGGLTWGRLGLTGDWATRPVTVHLLPPASGARGFLRDRVLGKDRTERAGKEHAKPSGVLAGVAADPAGLAVYRKAHLGTAVKAVPVASGDGPPLLRRPMTLVVPVDKNGEPAGAVRELLHLVLSRDGQEAVRHDGFTPLDDATLAAQVDKLGVAEPR